MKTQECKREQEIYWRLLLCNNFNQSSPDRLGGAELNMFSD